MPSLAYPATFGHQVKQIKITQVYAGGNGWEILIDNYRQGSVEKAGGEWRAHLVPGCQLVGDDLGVIFGMLEEMIL